MLAPFLGRVAPKLLVVSSKTRDYDANPHTNCMVIVFVIEFLVAGSLLESVAEYAVTSN